MPFKVRKNVHQTHLEDLVLLGPDGLEELNDKIEGTIDTLENNSGRINLTTKVDGAPAVTVWHTYPGYPDNSVALKGFITGPQNAMSTPEQVDAKYSDRPGMSQMLKYCLQIAPSVPAGEAWQGDCLFVSDTKREEEINGTDYITFQPNKIIYAFSENNPGYEQVKNADFGIAFHTIYKGENKSQSFKVDATKLNAPNNIYIMSPALNVSDDKKVFNLDKVREHFTRLEALEQKLLSNYDYEDLINNSVFMNYWNTFENANLADKKAVTIDENTFINDLKQYIKNKLDKDFEKKLTTLKTDKGKEKATQKYNTDVEELASLIDNNKELLTTLVKTLNMAATIKMLLWQGFKQSKSDYNTFYRSKTRGYLPGEMEGVAMSDQDGNIVKIVDRSTFSSYNRDPDILSGFEHPENITEEQNCFLEEYSTELKECDLWEQFNNLIESTEEPLVIAFGRLNPPTIGHQKLVDTMASLAKGNKARLYLSHTQDKKKNPLSYEQKIKYAKEAFEPEIDVVESDAKTIIDVLYDLDQEGFKNIIYVGGEDRIGGTEDISSLILRYNGQPTKAGIIPYNFDSIKFENAGVRNDDSDNLIEKASASLARQYAQEGNFKAFKEIVPVKDAEALYNDVRAGLGLSDNVMLEEAWQDFESQVTSYLNSLFNNSINEDLTEPILFKTMGENDSTVSDVACYYGENKTPLFYIECKQTGGNGANGGTFQLSMRESADGKIIFGKGTGRAALGSIQTDVDKIINELNTNEKIQSEFNPNTKNRIQIVNTKKAPAVDQKTIFITDLELLESMKNIVHSAYDTSAKNAPIIAANDKLGNISIGPLNSDLITVSNLTIRPKVDYVSNISKDSSRETLMGKLYSDGYINSNEDVFNYERGGNKKDYKVIFKDVNNKLGEVKHQVSTWPKIEIENNGVSELYYITPCIISPYRKDPNFSNLENFVGVNTENIYQIKKASVRSAYMCDAKLDINENSQWYNGSDEKVKNLIETTVNNYVNG